MWLLEYWWRVLARAVRRALYVIGFEHPWRLVVAVAVWLGTALVFIQVTENLVELQTTAVWALSAIAAAIFVLAVLVFVQIVIIPADLHRQCQQLRDAADTQIAHNRLERVRELLIAHTKIAPDANTRNTDTVDNWQRRAQLLLDTYLKSPICGKYCQCEPHCIQADLERSRASLEGIAINLRTEHLKE